MLTDEQRAYFDRQLEYVMGEMPPRVHELLREIPMYVDDYPSPQIMRRMRLRRPDQLCGLYTGVPLTQRSVELSGVLSDVIHIFRLGILSMATDRQGRLNETELRRQIRITVLHEVAHFFGIDDDELDDLGYA